jgi:negative regulator of flagellin synthesis FlgM
MTVEFFGVRGFGQIGGVRKTERPDDTDKPEKASAKGEASFSTALRGAGESMAAVKLESAERTARIQSLKQQVADGSYEPDLQKVASSLLKFLVEG